MEQRYLKMSEVATRSEENGGMTIEGYFVRYDDVYHVAEGATESIGRGAFTESIKGDVRALYNHNKDIVLGRTGAGTLELRDDEKGLWGKININPKDSQAVDVYQRIARGDISGCSFGFNIAEQDTQVREDGSVHWTIRKVDPLYEISPCTFPAYEATHVIARERDFAEIKKRELTVWREKTKERLHNGTKSIDVKKTD